MTLVDVHECDGSRVGDRLVGQVIRKCAYDSVTKKLDFSGWFIVYPPSWPTIYVCDKCAKDGVLNTWVGS